MFLLPNLASDIVYRDYSVAERREEDRLVGSRGLVLVLRVLSFDRASLNPKCCDVEHYSLLPNSCILRCRLIVRRS
jgi:hypothetical protein